MEVKFKILNNSVFEISVQAKHSVDRVTVYSPWYLEVYVIKNNKNICIKQKMDKYKICLFS
jgi:hypothetical protein